MAKTPEQNAPGKRPADCFAVSGFVLAIIGIATVGVLSPVAWLVCRGGLRGRRRQLAVAGNVISVAGNLILVFWLSFILWTCLSWKSKERMMGTCARFDQTETLLQTGLLGAIDEFRGDMGTFPPSSEGGLELLFVPGKGVDGGNSWRGPYLEERGLLRDAWGNEWHYEFPGIHRQNSYDLSSAGPDGVHGTEDDLVNWQ